MISRYPDIKVLAHKDVFGKAMKLAGELSPEDFEFIPPTFDLTSARDEKRFQEYQSKHKSAIYIAKPQVGAQGDSISLFK